jgi:hypothetical protein
MVEKSRGPRLFAVANSVPLTGNNPQVVVSVAQNEHPASPSAPRDVVNSDKCGGLPKEHAEKLCIPGPDFHQAQE